MLVDESIKQISSFNFRIQAGPLYLKNNREKAYICLFTCAVTRTVHLELISNMTTEWLFWRYDVWFREEECVILFGRTAQKLSNLREGSFRGVGEP